MREIHGVSRVRKVAVGEGDTQSVTVTDAGEFVQIRLTACSYPAEMTPQEARFVAAALIASADRVDPETDWEPPGDLYEEERSEAVESATT